MVTPKYKRLTRFLLYSSGTLRLPETSSIRQGTLFSKRVAVRKQKKASFTLFLQSRSRDAAALRLGVILPFLFAARYQKYEQYCAKKEAGHAPCMRLHFIMSVRRVSHLKSNGCKIQAQRLEPAQQSLGLRRDGAREFRLRAAGNIALSF